MPNKKTEDMWKHFFDRPKKAYNPYMVRLAEYPEYIMYDRSIMDSQKNRWNEYFGNENPIYLEIGSGSGNFANGMCEKYPERNHMAIEIRFKRLHTSARKAKKIPLNNVLFIQRKGEEILNFIGDEEIAGMYINFPEPWDHKPKNRVLQPSTIEMMRKIFKKGGKLFFKTDHDEYFESVLEFMKDIEGFEVVYQTTDLHNDPKNEDNVMTEFESLFLHKHNKNINYLEIEKL